MKKSTSFYSLFFIVFMFWAEHSNAQNPGIPISITINKWANNSWNNNDSRETWVYDANCFATSELLEKWDSTNQVWLNSSQQIYTNSSNGLNLQELIQQWNGVTNSWTDYLFNTYTYTASQKRDTVTSKTWSNGSWKNVNQIIAVYDGNNYLVADITYIDQAGSWKLDNKIIYANNASGNIITSVKQIWDVNSNTWINAEKISHTYNANGFEQTRFNEFWQNNSWQKTTSSYYYTQNFDVNNLITSIVLQYWNVSLSQYQNHLKQSITNNSAGYIIEVIDQDWNTTNSTWQNSLKHIIQQGCGATTSVPAINTGECKLYPNPSSSNFTVEVGNRSQLPCRLEVFNMKGEKVIDKTIISNEQLVSHNLPTGIYLTKLLFKGLLIKQSRLSVIRSY